MHLIYKCIPCVEHGQYTLWRSEGLMFGVINITFQKFACLSKLHELSARAKILGLHKLVTKSEAEKKSTLREVQAQKLITV